MSGSGPKSIYDIRRIGYKQAMDVVVDRHYLHRKAPCSFAFGLFRKEGGQMDGVIVYGTPSSAPLRRGICGDEEKSNVIELTRLWVDDIAPKNSESFLIGNTIGMVDKEIVVSYAECAAGHIGTVYQATNWLYTGLSAKRTNWSAPGLTGHSQTIADKYTSEQMRSIYGDGFVLVDRPRKHRYVYLNCSKSRRKVLLRKLKYPLLPYPKNP